MNIQEISRRLLQAHQDKEYYVLFTDDTGQQFIIRPLSFDIKYIKRMTPADVKRIAIY